MQQIVNNKYSELFTGNHRYVILMGGRSAGRSFVASQYAKAKLLSPAYFRCAIMRFVLSDVKDSIAQEIRDRIEEDELENTVKITDKPATFEYGQNMIKAKGFRKSSGDQKSKLKSLAQYNTIIIEEADEVSEEDFLQLDDSLRTVKGDLVIMMLNPPHKNHWIIKRWFNLVKSEVDGFYYPELKSTAKDTLYIHTTYLDNIENVNEKTVDNFENYKETKPSHYYNMIRGLVPEGATGRIFKDWKIIPDKEYEQLEYPETYGLDFGFTNDPTALTGVKCHNENVYLRELIYETGLTNPMIAQRFESLGISRSSIIYADNAEPKSIEELARLGWKVKPADKGQGSVNAGIDMLLSKKVHYTESSKNIDTEAQNYLWKLNREKESTNEPIDAFNHAMDSVRYNVYSGANKKFVGFV